MQDLKKDYRGVKNDAKETWRKADGEEDLGDKAANVGDDVRDAVGNAGDDLRNAGDDLRRNMDDRTDDPG